VRNARLLVEVLLSDALLFLNITARLLLLVALDGAGDRIQFTPNTVHGSIDVAFGLGGLDLGFTSIVLLLARLGPGFGTGQVSSGLDDGTLDRMELSSALARSGGVVGGVVVSGDINFTNTVIKVKGNSPIVTSGCITAVNTNVTVNIDGLNTTNGKIQVPIAKSGCYVNFSAVNAVSSNSCIDTSQVQQVEEQGTIYAVVVPRNICGVPPSPFAWWTIVAIVFGVVVLSLVVYFLVTRLKRVRVKVFPYRGPQTEEFFLDHNPDWDRREELV